MVGFEEILSSDGEQEEGPLSSSGDGSDNEDVLLAQFLESEVLAVDSDQVLVWYFFGKVLLVYNL
jgi:hypothetical protein